MTQTTKQPRWLVVAITTASACLLAVSARAETLLSDFDNNFFFDAMYASWADQEPLIGGAVDWSITATNYGSATTLFYEADGFTPKIVDASADQLLELEVSISTAPGNYAGPIVALEDADGTVFHYAWYGQSSGLYKLVALLSAPTYSTAAGSVPGLDLTNLVRFNIECDPGTSTNPVYTLTLMNLRTYPTPPPSCQTLISDFDNVGLLGGYASWASVPPPQPGNWTITATDFGGGFQDISPNINALGETMIELRLSITNTVGLVGPIVVLQDGDGTQETWPWYGLTNGSYVLTADLSAGNPVPAQPGTIPGMDFSNLDWFHLQVDDGTNTITYTVTFENLALIGFDPTIQDFSFDPNAGQFHLIWDSRPDRTYSVSYVSDLTGAFSILQSNILSGGVSTTNTVTVPAGDIGFLQVFEECQ